MKSVIYFLSAILLLSSCAKKAPPIDPIVVIKESPKALTAEQRKRLRHPESVRKYAVGRYTDPNNKYVLHEAHDIYRVETTSKWNHLPQRAEAFQRRDLQSLSQSPDSEELARLRQNLANERKTNSAIIAANKKLQESITPLTESFKHAKILAEQNAELRHQLHSKKLKAPPKKEPSNPKPVTPTQPKSDLLEWFDSNKKQ